jgi:hypothetical protein
VHTGRDYADVVPVRGVYRGPEGAELSVDVRVECEGAPTQPSGDAAVVRG